MNKRFKVGDKVRISKSREFGEYNFYFDKGDIVEIIYCGSRDVKYKRKKDGIRQIVPITCLEPLNNGEVIFNGNATILLKDGERYVSKCEDGDTFDREKGLLLCLAKANGVRYRDLQEMLANAERQISKKKKCKSEKKKCEGEKKCKEQKSYKTKYKVGDFVEVINSLKIYDTYDSWFYVYAPNLSSKYNMHKSPYENKTYRVVAVGKHGRLNDMLYAIEDFNKDVYLINEDGLKLANVREVKRAANVGEYVKVVEPYYDGSDEYKNGDILKIINISDLGERHAYYKLELSKYLYTDEYVVLENYNGK